MHKALFEIIGTMSAEKNTEALRKDIYKAVKARGLRKVIPYRDIILASQMVVKQTQQADSNMVVYKTHDNYYAKVTCKYYKVTR